jgi:hypothetical protein
MQNFGTTYQTTALRVNFFFFVISGFCRDADEICAAE